MKLSLVYVVSSREPWAEQALAFYHKKISPFCDFQRIAVKSPEMDRSENEAKKEKEAEKILKAIDQRATLIALDEKGKTFADSRAWSAALQKKIELGKPLQFVIGGAYGLAPSIKEKAQDTWTLSSLTFNHHLAQVVLLEQIYRAFTIQKNLPYHN